MKSPNNPSVASDIPNRSVGAYPFPSAIADRVREARKAGLVPDEWHAPSKNISEILGKIQEPILELGGPSDLGYYFLDGQVLPSRPIITNVAPNTLQFAPNAEQLNNLTDLIVDGRSMDTIPDASLGVVLSAHLSDVDEDSSLAQADDAATRLKGLMIEARNSKHISEELLELSLRLKIAKEVYKKLKPSGLYFTDVDSDELNTQSLLGFEPIAIYNRGSAEGSSNTDRYDVVFQKSRTVDVLDN